MDDSEFIYVITNYDQINHIKHNFSFVVVYSFKHLFLFLMLLLLLLFIQRNGILQKKLIEFNLKLLGVCLSME